MEGKMLQYQIHPDIWGSVKELLESANIPVARLEAIGFGASLLIDVPKDLANRVRDIIVPMCNR